MLTHAQTSGKTITHRSRQDIYKKVLDLVCLFCCLLAEQYPGNLIHSDHDEKTSICLSIFCSNIICIVLLVHKIFKLCSKPRDRRTQENVKTKSDSIMRRAHAMQYVYNVDRGYFDKIEGKQKFAGAYTLNGNKDLHSERSQDVGKLTGGTLFEYCGDMYC